MRGALRQPKTRARDKLRQDLAAHSPTSFHGSSPSLSSFKSWKRRDSRDESFMREMPSAPAAVIVRDANGASEEVAWPRKESLASLELEAGYVSRKKLHIPSVLAHA